MKLITHFDDFLKDTVNLNQTRVTLLEDSIEAIKTFIKNSDWKPEIIEFKPQGSWAHKTIIKPLTDYPFDADLIVYVKPVDGWGAKDYVNNLYTEFQGSGNYKEKTRRYSHCVTIEYAGERKIDIAPCVKDRLYSGTYEVCNRNSNEFEKSKPGEYTDWLIDKNSISGKNNLRKVTRLLKYMRDIKTTFTCPSFLLTTLLGERIYYQDSIVNPFTDVPTSLKVLIGRLDDWLQANETKPTVRNPVLYEEIQSNAWDETKYSNFRNKINLYRGWIDDAYDESDKEESIGKWRRVFGDDFAAEETVAKAACISESAVLELSGRSLASTGSDLVTLVKSLGSIALPKGFNRLPHMHRPKWRASSSVGLAVRVSAYLYTGRYGQQIRQITSLEPLQNGYWIKFIASSSSGLPFPNEHYVMWRVTNTDKAAQKAKALRGEFYESDSNNSRWECLQYRGVHIVEAFLIRKTTEVMLGKSEPFYVVIE